MFRCGVGLCVLPIGNRELGRSPYGVHDLAGNLYEWVAKSDPTSMRRTSGFAVPKTCPRCPRRGALAGGLARACRGAAGRLPGDEGIDHAGERASQDRGDPEEPELLQGPAVGKDRRGGAARRVEGEIGDRDAGPIDQRHGQADGQGGQALRCPAVRRPQNDEEKKEGEERFGAEAG